MRKTCFFLAVAIVIAASCNNNQGYKNVALMKAASQSSAWDLNQTAQLVTDGLLADGTSPWIDLRQDGKEVSPIERNYLTDFNVSSLEKEGEEGVFELTFHGIPFRTDRLLVAGNIIGVI